MTAISSSRVIGNWYLAATAVNRLVSRHLPDVGSGSHAAGVRPPLDRFAAAEVTTQQGATFFFATDPDGHVFELIEFPAGLKVLGDIAVVMRRD